MNMSNIISFPTKPSVNDLQSLATGRDRTAALGAIITRLKELRSRALKGHRGERRHYGDGRVAESYLEELKLGRLFVSFYQMESAVYFSIELSAPASKCSRVMTGCFDWAGAVRVLADTGEFIRQTGKFPAGVHVMSWKRGAWQAELFGDAPAAPRSA
jgi:hypothetical protein